MKMCLNFIKKNMMIMEVDINEFFMGLIIS